MTEDPSSKSCPLDCAAILRSLRDYLRYIEACTVPQGGDRVIVGVFRPPQLSSAYQQAVDSIANARFAIMAKFGERQPGPPGSAVVERTTLNVNGAGVDPMLYAGLTDASFALAWPPEVPGFEADDETRRPRFKFGDRVTEREYEALRAVITSFKIHLANWRHEVPPTPSPRDVPQAERASEPAVNELRCEGAAWSIRFGGVQKLVTNSRGMAMLAKLLASEGSGVSSVVLDGAAVVPGVDQEVMDEAALKRVHGELEALSAQRVRATATENPGLAARVDAEVARLEKELSRAQGLGGRSRKLGSEAQRARDRVGNALTAAIDHIKDRHPTAGEHLDRSVTKRYSGSPVYRPRAPKPVWVVSGE